MDEQVTAGGPGTRLGTALDTRPGAGSGADAASPRPSWTWLAVVATIVGLVPLGLVALWFSSSVLVALHDGDAGRARRAARWSVACSVAALVLEVVGVVALGVVGVERVVSATS